MRIDEELAPVEEFADVHVGLPISCASSILKVYRKHGRLTCRRTAWRRTRPACDIKQTHMTAQEARMHIRYSGWASRKVLEAALALSPEDRAKPMSVSHESIAKTLSHIYFADAIWYSRIADSSYPVPSHDALPSLEFVIAEWPRLQAKWEA